MNEFTRITFLFTSLSPILLLAAAISPPLAADEIHRSADSTSANGWPERQPVRAQFVHRPARHSPEWEHYRAMELYYDDLEDHYRWRDRRLSNYYERFEGYYEDLRKGRSAVYPDVQPHHIYPHGGPHNETLRGGMPRMTPNRTAAMPNIASPKTQSPLPPSGITQSEPQSALEQSYRELLTQLSGLTTGVRWREYLKLPIGQQAFDSREQLEEAAVRYDQISTNPDYQVVTQLPAFEATRNLLHEQLYSSEMGPTLAEPELAPAEELPLPVPSATVQ